MSCQLPGHFRPGKGSLTFCLFTKFPVLRSELIKFQESLGNWESATPFPPSEAVPEIVLYIIASLRLPQSKPAHEETVRTDSIDLSFTK